MRHLVHRMTQFVTSSISETDDVILCNDFIDAIPIRKRLALNHPDALSGLDDAIKPYHYRTFNRIHIGVYGKRVESGPQTAGVAPVFWQRSGTMLPAGVHRKRIPIDTLKDQFFPNCPNFFSHLHILKLISPLGSSDQFRFALQQLLEVAEHATRAFAAPQCVRVWYRTLHNALRATHCRVGRVKGLGGEVLEGIKDQQIKR